MITATEEDYLKAIYKIAEKEKSVVTTNAIAGQLNTSAPSVTDMLKKLKEKGMVHYQKYKGVTLTPSGNRVATTLIRKHRLWEVFLVEKLNFSWEQVHDIAEQLEHIRSVQLVNRLDNYLGNPKFDPHGDPIPNAEGKFTLRNQQPLHALQPGDAGIVIGVKEHDTSFLQHLNSLGIKLGTKLTVRNYVAYDGTMEIFINEEIPVTISRITSNGILVKRTN